MTETSPCTARKTGISGYVTDKCRCRDCRAAKRAYENRRSRLIAYGRWQGLIDAGPTRQHLAELRAAGCGVRQIAAITGLPIGAIAPLVWSCAGRRAEHVQAATAAAILAVDVDSVQLADGAIVDGTATRRQMQALVAIGWTVADQARDLGREVRNHTRIIRGGRVTAATARLVADQFDRLSTTPAPDGANSRRARNWARQQGWPPPLAWEDVDLSDPAAVPNLGAEDDDSVDEVLVARVVAGDVPFKQLNEAERVALFQGPVRTWSDSQTSKRLRMSTVTIDRWRARAEQEVAA